MDRGTEHPAVRFLCARPPSAWMPCDASPALLCARTNGP